MFKGVDVSHWQGAIAWCDVAESGVAFAYLKATEGTGMIDDRLVANCREAKAAGIKVGFYHFAYPDNDPIEEAEHFLSTVDALTPDLLPALDLEHAGTQKSAAFVVNWAQAWLDHVENAIGQKPIVYTYPWFANNIIGKALTDYPLWIAQYTNAPSSFAWDAWAVWQASDKGRVPGIDGTVDIDYAEVLPFMNQLSVEDANTLIAILAVIYEHIPGSEAETHRLANELRKASCQPITD